MLTNFTFANSEAKLNEALVLHHKIQIIKHSEQFNYKLKTISTGTLLACLVNCIAPGLIPNWASLSPDDRVESATKAMDLADTWLGVPKLLSPEDLTSANVS